MSRGVGESAGVRAGEPEGAEPRQERQGVEVPADVLNELANAPTFAFAIAEAIKALEAGQPVTALVWLRGAQRVAKREAPVHVPHGARVHAVPCPHANGHGLNPGCIHCGGTGRVVAPEGKGVRNA